MSKNDEIKLRLRGQYLEIKEGIVRAYEQKLKESYLYWKHDPHFSFPYNGDNSGGPSIAYDVQAIPTRALGQYFIQLLYDPPLEANKRCKSREAIRAGQGFETLMHELQNELLPDPLNETLAVVPNRWPRAAYHCLLLSREWRPQRLAPEFVQAQLEWAARGFVVMFHRRGVLLNHFHMHIFMPETAPIMRFVPSFHVVRKHAELEEGVLRDYPVPCIALVSTGLKVLYRAITLMVNQLDAEDRWFNQVVLRDPESGKVIALFFLWPDVWMNGFYFDPIGLVRSSNTKLTEDYVIAEVQRAHTKGEELNSVRAIFWNAWEKTGSLDTLKIAGQATQALQQVDSGWTHADHQALSQGDLRQVFDLYAKTYAGSRWTRFRIGDQASASTEQSLRSFRKFYHHAFLLRDAMGHVVAFMLGKDTPFGVKFCLGGTDGSHQIKAVFVQSFFSLMKVSGVYAQLSGRMREVVLNDCNDILSARMMGQPMQSACPIINPRLASYLMGIETALDPDGVHCHWQYFVLPETNKVQTTRTLIVGTPILGHDIAQSQQALSAHVSDSFLISQRYENLMAQWDAHTLTVEEAYRHLTRLLTNEYLFTRSRKDKLTNHQEPTNPIAVRDALELWREKILKVKLLADLYCISNTHPYLEHPSLKAAQAIGDLLSYEKDIAWMVSLKNDPIAREIARSSEEAKNILAKNSRVVLSERFRSRYPVAAEGKMEVINLLLSHLPGGVNASQGGVIGIGGAAGIGKSTFAGYIRDHLEKEGKEVIITPMDAFLKPRQDFQLLVQALYGGRFEETLWDMRAYSEFLRKVSEFRQTNQPTIQITITEYYDRLTKVRSERTLCLTKETIMVIEGGATVDSRSKKYFDVTVTLDVRDDQLILDNLLTRLNEATLERQAYIKERFWALDRPYAAYRTWAEKHFDYNYIMDNSEFNRPILYSTTDSIGQF